MLYMLDDLRKKLYILFSYSVRAVCITINIAQCWKLERDPSYPCIKEREQQQHEQQQQDQRSRSNLKEMASLFASKTVAEWNCQSSKSNKWGKFSFMFSYLIA